MKRVHTIEFEDFEWEAPRQTSLLGAPTLWSGRSLDPEGPP